MAVSLTLIAIERDHIHLVGCLLEKLVCERAFDSINDKSVEPLIYIGISATYYNPSACSPQSKPSADVIDIVNFVSQVYLFECQLHNMQFSTKKTLL